MKIKDLRKIGDRVYYLDDETFNIRDGIISGVEAYNQSGENCLCGIYKIDGKIIKTYIGNCKEDVIDAIGGEGELRIMCERGLEEFESALEANRKHVEYCEYKIRKLNEFLSTNE